MERITLGKRSAEPFGRLQPCRMTRTIIILKAVDSRREYFDLARRRLERVAGGIRDEFFQEGRVTVRGRKSVMTDLPKFIAGWPRVIAFQRDVASLLVHESQPLHFVASFGEVGADAQPVGQFRKNVEVVASS